MTRPIRLLLLLLAPGVASADGPLVEASVGMSAKLDGVVIAGPELEAKPSVDRDTPVVLRVVKAYPHGSDFRYDLEFYGLAPGTHDLMAYLRRTDGQPLAPTLRPLPVKVVPVLPPGQVKPNALEIQPAPPLGGYGVAVTVGVIAWLVGLLAVVGWMAAGLFRKRESAVADRPVSLADKLRPLVEGAIAGKLSHTELANLERGLLAYWRKKLNLETTEPAAAISQLRAHPDAGPLLGRLEEWLHKPGPPAAVDVGELLRPYQDLPPDDAEVGVKA